MPHTNQLINETSPYLQQHAHNPVDWFPWCEQALEKARQENKPILLSIGYAACHWCHVMAHESFEDNETAALMNKLFINIKVDKEERPDLDKIYQTTHYLLSRQSGGWPLTVFLAPQDLTPFFSGTYFPREDNYQLPAFKKVLEHIAETYQHHQTEISLQNQELQKILNPLPPVISDVRLNSQPIQHAEQVLERSYDAVNGGFGTAPKFPQPARLQFLFSSDSIIPFETLLHMAKGGICDQVDGGFFRYSVDAGWQIPHFEKMLYDNAQLLFLLSTAFKKYGEVVFADTAHAAANWVMQTMQSAEGGYYASLDADSEGHEGKYYVWDKNEVASLLTQEEFSFIEKYYGLDQPPNFENHWHLAANPNLPADQTILEAANKKLLAARKKRIPPAKDTKILTSWNALMIKAMLTAGTLLNQPHYIQSAKQALSFIKNHHWINHQLLSTKNYNAYLDDYAFLLDSVLLSLQISWDTTDLTFAMELCEILLKDFYDTKAGGFYFTPHDHEKLLYRPKSMMDEVTPSGNAVAARCLFLAGHLLGETRYIDAATKTLHAAWPMLTQYPAEHCALLQVLRDYLKPPVIIIIRGNHDEIKKWQTTYQTLDNTVFAIPADEKNLPGLLNLKKPKDKTCAYICEGMHCREIVG